MPRSPHSDIIRARTEVARAARASSHNADPKKVEAARRLLENNRAYKARIADIVASAPPLTAEQVDAVAAILLGQDDGTDGGVFE
ncbi:hypothetical protein [Pseudarthrobacter sp. fls2-241-R2A-127]|uniref:hypothetical protein n=1 Tax=Pseudarthrobacter sp. fls2-241-R2A-127 TaxID=3040303 RepID=UPI0025548992|nr:hypothetical protein [Pseudarthrobacter sp. fls2-241-R2A-127]